MDCLKMNLSSENKLPRISFGEEQIDQRLTSSLTPYNYCANNLLILVDPFGKFHIDIHSQIVNVIMSTKSYL